MPKEYGLKHGFIQDFRLKILHLNLRFKKVKTGVIFEVCWINFHIIADLKSKKIWAEIIL